MMQWSELSHRMERSVIKKDSTATDNEYFMATHVPFKDLQVIESGDANSEPFHLTEEEVYSKYVLNRSNRHQMILVLGTAGTGKSHLICWLYNRLNHDIENYNPEKEKIIFLRRLGNTSRGAVKQMLDAGMVQDEELKKKFTSYVNADSSQSEEELKQTIFNSYITKAQTDRSGKIYSPSMCRDIASFLRDLRVQEYLLGDGGPVSRCYRMITAGVNPDDEDASHSIFTPSDFNFPRDVVRRIKNEASAEARDFYIDTLRGDDEAAEKLAEYLNGFTSAVIQSCANITSENARDLFVDLRRQLLNEGKNLTLLIEDFTSFSIVDSELITALAVENGGGYSDLCRVTSIIGITSSYFKLFKDNFQDRVSTQIHVIDQSFSDKAFLEEMAARYLNAIYCEPKKIADWYELEGGRVTNLPVSNYKPAYPWDSVIVDGKEMTLYPFTKRSLQLMFQNLKVKSPRHFLDYAIKQMFRQFATGKDSNDWIFPEIPSYISTPSMDITYASSVEDSSLNVDDKGRLKALLAVWGDGTTNAERECTGSIPNAFLQEIALGSFTGLVQSSLSNVSQETPTNTVTLEIEHEPVIRKSKEELQFDRYCEDLQKWFDEGSTLHYDADYFTWITKFVLYAIPWQDEGIPAYFVDRRKSSGNFAMIEGSEKDINPENVVIYLPKSSETRNVLYALANFNLHKSWIFKDAEYYQLVLINWLEKNKESIKGRILRTAGGSDEHLLITWCLAIEYLQRRMKGENLPQDNDFELLKVLLGKPYTTSIQISRSNQAWNQTVQAFQNNIAAYKQANLLLVAGANSQMGIVADTQPGTAKIYRYNELLSSLQHLKGKKWDISDELIVYKDNKFYSNIIKLLSDLYSKINFVAKSEKELAQKTAKSFETILGSIPTKSDLVELQNEIHKFYAQCRKSNHPYKTDLESKFNEEPIEFAQRVYALYENVCNADNFDNAIELLTCFAADPVAQLNQCVQNLEALGTFADSVKRQFNSFAGGSQTSVDTTTAELAINELDAILEITEQWEVVQ